MLPWKHFWTCCSLFIHLHNGISRCSYKCYNHKIFTFKYNYSHICGSLLFRQDALYSLGHGHFLRFATEAHYDNMTSRLDTQKIPPFLCDSSRLGGWPRIIIAQRERSVPELESEEPSSATCLPSYLVSYVCCTQVYYVFQIIVFLILYVASRLETDYVLT